MSVNVKLTGQSPADIYGTQEAPQLAQGGGATLLDRLEAAEQQGLVQRGGQTEPIKEKGFGAELLESIAQPFTSTLSSGIGSIEGLVKLAQSAPDGLSQEELNAINSAVTRERDYGIFGKAAPVGVTPEQAAAGTSSLTDPTISRLKGMGQFTGDVVGTGAELGSYIAPAAIGASVAKGAVPTLKAFTAGGALAGGLGEFGRSLQDQKGVGQTILNTALGTGIGAATGLATGAIGKGATKLAQKIGSTRAAQKVGEVGTKVGQKYPKLSSAVATAGQEGLDVAEDVINQGALKVRPPLARAGTELVEDTAMATIRPAFGEASRLLQGVGRSIGEAGQNILSNVQRGAQNIAEQADLPAAERAVRSLGLQPRFINQIRDASSETVQAIGDVLGTARQMIETNVGDITRRGGDVVVDMLQAVNRGRVQIGKQLEEMRNALPDDDLIDADVIGREINEIIANYSGLDTSTRRALQAILREIPEDAANFSTRQLAEINSALSAAQRNITSIMRVDGGTIKKIVDDIQDVIEARLPDEYLAIVQQYAEARSIINQAIKEMGIRRADGTFYSLEDFIERGGGLAGERLRRTLSNIGAARELLYEELERVARLYGYAEDINLSTLVQWTDFIEKTFGLQNPASLGGNLRDTGAQAIDAVAGGLLGGPGGSAITGLFNRIRGMTRADAIKALEDFITELLQRSDDSGRLLNQAPSPKVNIPNVSQAVIDEAKKFSTADDFIRGYNQVPTNSIELYRGLEQPLDSSFNLQQTDAPIGYSTWTDNPELARQYAGDSGYVYRIRLPKSEQGNELINVDGDRALFVNNEKPAALNGISGDEYLIYQDHDNFSPELISEYFTDQRLREIFDAINGQ